MPIGLFRRRNIRRDEETGDDKRTKQTVKLFDFEEEEPDIHCKYCPSEKPLEILEGYEKFKQELHLFVEDERHSTGSFWFAVLIISAICISTIAYILQTVPRLSTNPIFEYIEVIVTIIFTLEYIVRLFASKNRCAFVLSKWNIIDLVAFMPYYLELLLHQKNFSVDVLRVVRVVRTVRLFRVFKMQALRDYMDIIKVTMILSRDGVGLVIALVLLQLIIFSSFVYVAERGVNPQFIDIPTTFWWCVVTITTVGYGDMSPITPWGRFFGSISMFIGVLVIATPVIIIGGNFEESYYCYKKIKYEEEFLSGLHSGSSSPESTKPNGYNHASSQTATPRPPLLSSNNVSTTTSDQSSARPSIEERPSLASRRQTSGNRSMSEIALERLSSLTKAKTKKKSRTKAMLARIRHGDSQANTSTTSLSEKVGQLDFRRKIHRHKNGTTSLQAPSTHDLTQTAPSLQSSGSVNVSSSSHLDVLEDSCLHDDSTSPPQVWELLKHVNLVREETVFDLKDASILAQCGFDTPEKLREFATQDEKTQRVCAPPLNRYKLMVLLKEVPDVHSGTNYYNGLC